MLEQGRDEWDELRDGATASYGERNTLYHYTNAAGLQSILSSKELHASTATNNPNDVRYGNGQYLSDVVPGTKTLAQLSRLFLGMPFLGGRFTHYVEIEVRGLDVRRGRPGVFVVPNDHSLDLTGRIVSAGVVPIAPTK